MEILSQQYFIKSLLNLMKENIQCSSQGSSDLFYRTRKFNRFSKTIDIKRIPKQMLIESLEVSDNGQSGVIFIQLNEGTFVLKPSPHCPKGMFFNDLAKILGLCVPEMSFFTHEDELYSRIYQAIGEYCQRNHEQCLYARLKIKLNLLFFEIYEYIPSVFLTRLGPNKFESCITHSSDWLHSIGLCLGFDMIVNNHDRFKLIWRGEGNIENFLVRASQSEQYVGSPTILLEEIVFIDNEGQFCDVSVPMIAMNLERYFQKVASFHRKMLNFVEGQKDQMEFLESEEVKNLKQQIFLCTNYELSGDNMREIVKGIKEMTIRYLHLVDKKEILSLLEEISGKSETMLMDFTKKHWKQEIEGVNYSFCEKICEILSPIYCFEEL